MAPEGKRGGNMGGQNQPGPEMKFGNGSTMELSYDYRVFFTNEACKAYLEYLPSQVSSAKTAEDRKNLADQMRTVAAVYATVIYQIYPNKPLFKKAIDSDPALSSNFKRAKEWIDMNGYGRLSDAFVSTVASLFVNQGAV